eukprot:1091904-Prymnesium_polylepis.1
MVGEATRRGTQRRGPRAGDLERGQLGSFKVRPSDGGRRRDGVAARRRRAGVAGRTRSTSRVPFARQTRGRARRRGDELTAEHQH